MVARIMDVEMTITDEAAGARALSAPSRRLLTSGHQKLQSHATSETFAKQALSIYGREMNEGDAADPHRLRLVMSAIALLLEGASSLLFSLSSYFSAGHAHASSSSLSVILLERP